MNKLMSKIKIVQVKLKLISLPSTSRFGYFDLFRSLRRCTDLQHNFRCPMGLVPLDALSFNCSGIIQVPFNMNPIKTIILNSII
jgi:hypothetical protein